MHTDHLEHVRRRRHRRAKGAASRTVLERYARLDVLVDNVGGFWAHRHVTAEGLDHTFCAQPPRRVLLTNRLLDRTKGQCTRPRRHCVLRRSRWAGSTSTICWARTSTQGSTRTTPPSWP